MRNVLLFLMLSFLFLSCSKGGDVEIKFNISNKNSDEIKLYVLENEYLLDVDESGRALKTIIIPESTYAYVYYNNRMFTFYLTPKKNIDISFDANDRSERIFLYCDDDGISSYMAIESNISYDSGTAFYRLDEEKYLNSLKDNIDKKRKYLQNKKLPVRFKEIEKERIAYKALDNIFFYPSYRKYFYKKKDYEPSEAYNNFIDSMFVQSPELLRLQSYRDFLIRYVEKKTLGVMSQKERLARVSDQVEYVLSNVGSYEISDFLINAFVYPFIERKGIEGCQSLINIYKEKVRNSCFRKKFLAMVERYESIEKGKPSPSFSFKDINGDMVSLESLRGKYLYIGVWATWCRPCRNELLSFQRLVKEYKDKNISFVCVSLDDNYKSWQYFVKRNKMQGIQLFAGNDQAFSSNYMINTIPRFILIDKNGIIVNSKMERPSESGIRNILNNLSGI